MHSSLIEDLSKDSLLKIIPGLSEVILREGRIYQVTAQQKIAAAGDPIASLIIPVDFGFRLTWMGGIQPTRYLQRRQSLALGELLRNEPYPYFVYAETLTRVVSLPAAVFRKHLATHPSIEHYLKLMTSSLSTKSFKSFLEHRNLPFAEILDFFSAIRPEPVALGEGQAVQLDEPSLLLIKSGTLRAASLGGARAQYSAELGEGAWIGGRALVAPYRWDYELKVTRPAVFHFAPLSAIAEITKRNGLIETLFDEPWLSPGQEAAPQHEDTTLSELPGEALSPKKIRTERISPTYGKITGSTSDQGSFVATIVNACLIAGCPVSETSVRQSLRRHGKITALRVAEILESHGLFSRGMRLRLDAVEATDLPAIIRVGPRMMLLVKILRAARRVILHDPARGLISLSMQQLSESWDGQAILFHKEKTDFASSSSSAPAADASLFSILRGSRAFSILLQNRARLSLVLGLSAFGVLLRLLIPPLYQTLLNDALTLNEISTLGSCVAGILIVSGLVFLVQVASHYARELLSSRFEYDLKSVVFRHAFLLPAEAFSKRFSAEVNSRIEQIDFIARFISGTSVDGLLSVATLIVYFIVLSVYSIKIALLSLPVIFAILWVGRWSQSRLNTLLPQAIAQSIETTHLQSEQITAMAAIKDAVAERAMLDRWTATSLENFSSRLRLHLDFGLAQGVVDWIGASARIGAVWIAAYIALRGELNVGQILCVSLYFSQMIEPALRLQAILSESGNAALALRQTEELLRMPIDSPLSDQLAPQNLRLGGKIRFDRVSFRYAEDLPWVVHELSFTIFPNETVAIVGRSGGGKSTIAGLLAGTLKPSAGRILFDGFDSRYLAPHYLRSQIGFILQKSELFGGTIEENISYADDAPDPEAIAKALSAADALDFVQELPRQFEHRLGPGGVGVSGGERQRLGVARTLYRDPKIILLDEATSALDTRSERLLTTALEETLKDKTVVLIAHRLSTVRNANRIVVVDDGRIVEEGSHETLLRENGHYAELFGRQINLDRA